MDADIIMSQANLKTG